MRDLAQFQDQVLGEIKTASMEELQYLHCLLDFFFFCIILTVLRDTQIAN